MTELVDAKMVEELSRIFTFAPERIIWGQLFTAKLYWTKHYSSVPGTAMLPYMAFYRVPKFHDRTKKQEMTQVVDFDGKSKEMKFLPVMLSYTVEVMTKTVREQNQLFKQFMFWASSEGAISFKDDYNIDWAFRVIAEDPEDASDLESEEDMGRVIRSTFTIMVESIMFDRSKEIAGPVIDILARIHGYYDSIDDTFPIGEINITG
jgi:hypothetical protein